MTMPTDEDYLELSRRIIAAHGPISLAELNEAVERERERLQRPQNGDALAEGAGHTSQEVS